MTLIDKRFTRFLNDMKHLTIEEYFGIVNNNSHTKLKFNIKKEENNIILNTNFIRSYNVDIIELPKEINDLISSYASEYVNINFNISHDTYYPFHSPVWSLLNISYNIKPLLNVKSYYEYIIKTHNDRYEKDWSPAICMEKDILEFIQKINYFDYLFEYK